MIELRYPAPVFNTRLQGKGRELFDPIRQRWVSLTPEEWVRQQFVQLLVQEHHYPSALIAIEKTISIGDLSKRFDLLVHDASHRPWMMIECKASSVTLDASVLEQLLRYNMSVPVQYLLITNGLVCLGWERVDNTLVPLSKIPLFRS